MKGQDAPPRTSEINLAHEASFTLGLLRVSPSTREIRSSAGEETVEPRVMQALVCLARSDGTVVSRDDLIRCCWGGRIVGEDAINRCIAKVRQIAEKNDGPSFVIETIPRVGYRLRRAAPSPAPAIDPPESAIPIAPAADADSHPPAAPAAIAQSRPRDGAPNVGSAPSADRRRAAGARLWVILAVVAAALAGSALFWRDVFPSGSVAPRLSVAVLPFRNLGGDAQDDYLADAVGDDLTTDLSHLPGSFVIARSSVAAYAARPADAGQIGRELGVRYLVEGSLRRAGETISINAQLVDTGTGAQLWAERFDAPRQMLADTQRTIERRIAGALDFKLVQIEGRRSLQDRPDNPDALDLFLRARSILDRGQTLQALNEAQPLLEQAIALQPDFVGAMSELAWLLLKKARDFDDPTDAKDMSDARKLISRGVELAPRNARILAARGFLQKLDGMCPEAIASYQQALSFDVSDIDARDGLALCAVNLGRPEEAARNFEEILLIDPQDPRNYVRYNQFGLVLLMLGRNEQAIAWFVKAEAADPSPKGPNESLTRQEWNEVGLIAAYGLTGQIAAAKAKYADYARLWPHRTVWRLASYFTKAEAALPGFQAAMAALKAAGMPEFADESPDDGAPSTAAPKTAGDFEPTPAGLPGAGAVATSELKALLAGNPPPIVVDVGCGVGVIAGAVWINDTFPSEEGHAHLEREVESAAGHARDRGIVIMGCSKYDWNAYNAALALIGLGYRKILWYRGGEEAWVAAGLPAEDRRNP